ncbi:MAG TPA: FG-GAP-like repeat-containing protein [Kofleriaceae bacterium]
MRLAIALAFALAPGVAGAVPPAAGSVTSERLKLPSGPSSIRGLADEPAVDPIYAQVSHSVPIELPAGRGGLTPALAISYSGALGNGPLGIGWALATVKIERSLRLGVPRYDDGDELVISGVGSGRLVAIGGGEYRVEGMGQTVRVRKVGDGFEVDDGSGVHYRLGATAQARHADAARTRAWLVEEQTNLAGEQVRYSYDHDGGQVYLARIAWGPSDAFAVELAYEARGDVTTSYREGFRVVTARRLAAVRVVAFGVERRAYQLAYDTTLPEALPVARLTGVTSTGRARKGEWPALAFDYATTAPPTVVPVPGVGSWRLNSNGVTLVDLDGDGAAELLRLADGGHSYLVNQNGTFGGLQTLSGNTQSITTLQLQDLDGDARAELVQDSNDGWVVWKFSRTRWLLQPGVWPGSQGLALKQPATTRYADLDGDGLVDAIQWDNDHLKVRRATRTGFLPVVVAPRIGGAVLPVPSGRFHDMNGDGLDDYVVVAPTRLEIYLGRGDGTFEPMSVVGYPFSGSAPSPDNLWLADLDRDDLVDLVRVDLGTVRWYRGHADGSFATSPVTVNNPEPLSSDVVVAITDINGNGSQDVVWSSASGMWRLDLAGATTAGMLVRVRNGLGMETAFRYRSAHELSVEARQAADAWLYEVPIAMPVPVEKTTALGPGETARTISYSVRDGRWDADERRFGGFLGTIVTTWGPTPAETSSVQTRYHTGIGADRVLRGMPLVEQVRNGAGVRLSFTSSTWQAMPITGLPDVPLLRRAVLRERRTRHEDTAPLREARITYEYDALGRQRRAVDQGRLDLDHDDSTRETRYADDDTTWVRDQLCEDKVLGAGGEVVSHVQHLFGDASAVQPLCAVGAGWPRETRAWLAGEARFVTQNQTEYDARGNPIRVVDHGVARALSYDATGLFPIEERVAAAAGRDLVWRASWDGVLGVPTALTDPDGHVVHASHDDLGRFTGPAIDGEPARMVIAYDWTAPFPKTTTWQFDGPADELPTGAPTWSSSGRWRQSVEVANGKGEVRYRALRNAQQCWIISDYRERDPASRVVFAGRPIEGDQLELTGRPAGITGDQLVYDPLGRLIEQRLPTGTRRVTTYTAFDRTVQDADLAPVHHALDGQGRVFLTERSLPDGTHETVEARRDAAGRLTRMWLAGGAVERAFTYDTLGRLVQTSDPDLGVRTLRWDDGDRLIEQTNPVGQTVHFTYDALGRLATRDGGGAFTYHYDDPRAGAGPEAINLSGRLAWVDEPTGRFELGYDDAGRVRFARRTVDDRLAEETTEYSASGLVLGRSFDDGFAVTYRHDAAGRVIGANNLWELVEQDAAGRTIRERFGNGVDARYNRDVLGLTTKVTLRDAAGAAIYDVDIARNAWSAITGVTDVDGAGLDHSATFSYDGFARLTGATAGTGAAAFTFGYGYDVLHNMTSRTATGPRALGAFTGSYHHGEAGKAPRQLTSITGASGAVTHTFDYDAAGRQIAQDGLSLSYDPYDRLLSVTGVSGGTVQHRYGHDGERVKTIAPGGDVSYFFAHGLAERAGSREHDVEVGSRVVARVTVPPASGLPPPDTGVVTARRALLGLWGSTLGGLLLAVLQRRPRTRRLRVAMAALLGGLLVSLSCAPIQLGSRESAEWGVPLVTYFHPGVAAGPAVFTNAAGQLLEERRFEPYGDAIDARILRGAVYDIGSPDLAARDLNALNKRTDGATGWSDHGARWLAPETARWLTTDPPVQAPDAKFMIAPWSLHPYQYVEQNPIAYWDPDGRQPRGTDGDDEEESPGEEIAHGFKSFIPGLGQMDGLKIAVAPLQSDKLSTGQKLGYAIISPIPIFVGGTLSELLHTLFGIGHIAQGTFRAITPRVVNKPIKLRFDDIMPSPRLDLQPHQDGAPHGQGARESLPAVVLGPPRPEPRQHPRPHAKPHPQPQPQQAPQPQYDSCNPQYNALGLPPSHEL